MSRSRIVFLLIIASAIGLVVVAQVVQRLPTAPTPTPLPRLQIEVAVNPLAFDWVTEQAKAFNQQNPNAEGQPYEIRVTQRDGIDIWQTGGVWTSVNHPAAWIPEATFSIDYAAEAGARYEVLAPSVASTPLVWGIFTDRGALIPAPVDWPTLTDAVAKESWSALGGQEAWGFIKPAIPFPSRSTAGYSVLLTAAASYAKNAQLTPQTVSDRAFQQWLQPVAEAVPNFTSLGQRPAQTLASRGASLADFALLPESDWLVNFDKINSRQAIRFTYPAYNVIFDMPFAVWSGSETTPATRSAAKAFSDFLGQASAQKRAAAFGLRPASIKLSEADTSLFAAAGGVGIVMDPPPGSVITVPPRNSALGLLSWFRSIRSS